MAILRTVPTTLALAALEKKLNDSEAALSVDGQTIRAQLTSITASKAETPDSRTAPVDVNLVSFMPVGDVPLGAIELVGEVPPESSPDDRQAFFDSLENSPLTFICFSDVFVEGASQEVVVCRQLDAPVPPAPVPPSPTPPVPGAPAPSEAVLRGDGTWPFTAEIDGDDIVVHDVIITCFGDNGDGTNSDPQDQGDTASGVNTNNNSIDGVSIAMDGRQFATLASHVHAALDGAPIPRLRKNGRTAWNTIVEVTIGSKTLRPAAGILDLGPGKQASRPGEPHGLDLTVPAVGFFAPEIPLEKRSTEFSARGSFRIIGGAQLLA